MDQLEQKVEDLRLEVSTGFTSVQKDIQHILKKIDDMKPCTRAEVETNLNAKINAVEASANSKIKTLETDAGKRDKWFYRINVALFFTLVVSMFKDNIAKLFS